MNVLESIPDLLKRYNTEEALESYPVYVFKVPDPPHDLLAFDMETCTFVPIAEYEPEYSVAFTSRSKQYHWSLSLPYQIGKMWSWCIGYFWRGKFLEHPNQNAWHYMYEEGVPPNDRFNHRDAHPNALAGDLHNRVKLEGHHGNGVGPDFNILDPYFSQGLVKELLTDKVVELPDLFNCYLCMDGIDWRKLEEYHEIMYSAKRAAIDTNPIVKRMEQFGFDDVFVPDISYSVAAIVKIMELTDKDFVDMREAAEQLKEELNNV